MPFGLLLGALALAVTTLSGCAACLRRSLEVYDALHTRCAEAYELSGIRSDTRQELAGQRAEARQLAAERQVAAARAEAERLKLEAEFCKANMAAERDLLAANVQDNLRSKVAFNVEQGLEVGELEVDFEELKKLLAEREKEPATRQIPAKKPCKCCDQPCGCKPGLLRRLCPHCCRKGCDAEENCGGPLAAERIAQNPARRPIKPAEIPMRLPVRLTFGMQNPVIQGAEIVRRPAEVPCNDIPCTAPCSADLDSSAMLDPGAPPVPQRDQIVPAKKIVETEQQSTPNDISEPLPDPESPAKISRRGRAGDSELH